MTVSGLTPRPNIPPSEPIRTRWAEPGQHRKTPQKPWLFDLVFLFPLFSITSGFLLHLTLSFSSFRDFFFFFFRSRWRSSGEREPLRSDQSGRVRTTKSRSRQDERAGPGPEVFLTSPSSSSCSLYRGSARGCGGVCCASAETLASWTFA